ncbi:MAG: hypothetical protein KDK33_14645 [Leptospiraceae bacterium]|nr:hypothetical protein [Leptospiraceae bacterium]
MIAVSSIGFACLALALGMILYHRVEILRRFLIQPALLGGVLLLLLGGQGFSLVSPPNYEAWSQWPGFLISFLFSSLILAAPTGDARFRRGGAVFFQGAYVWVLAIGQIAIGLFVISLFDKKWWLAGHIIEIGWMGGHGSAAALIAVADSMKWPAQQLPASTLHDAAQLGLFSATIGLLYGAVSGMAMVNWIRRKEKRLQRPGKPESRDPLDARAPGRGAQKAIGGSMDDNAGWLVAILGTVIPVVLAYFLLSIVGTFAHSIYPAAGTWIEKMPLFFVALTLAFPVRKLMDASGLVETERYQILNSLILEFLILSAGATLNLGLLLDSWPILLALSAGGAAWTGFCFWMIAPRILEDHPDLSLINYGMSTGVTALGLLLVRALRGRIPSHSATVYGMAAPFSAPFIGGGILSLLLPLWTITVGPWWIAGLLSLTLIPSVLALIWMRRKSSSHE